MKDHGTRVLGVARQSGRKEDATTIPKIREEVARVCGRQGFELVYIAEDGGVSGKYSPFDLAKRKDLAPWLTDPELIARWDILMFTHGSRLVRKARFSDELFEWCGANGKAVMKTDGHVIDYNDDGEWLSVNIDALMNEQYRRYISRERRKTARHLAAQGKLGYGEQSIGYGFTRGDDGLPVVVPAEAEVLRKIAGMIVSGMTLTAVRAALRAEGLRTRRGGTWDVAGMSRMLRRLDQPYAHAADGSPHFWPEIIDPATLARVRAELDRRSFKTRPKEDSTRHDGTMLLQVAFCPETHPLYSMTGKGNSGKSEYRYYRCGKCWGRLTPMAELDGLASEWITGHLGALPWLEKTFVPASGHERELAGLRRRRDDAEGQVIAGILPAASAGRILAALEQRITELEAVPSRPARYDWTETGKTLADAWQGLDRPGRNRALRDMGARLTVRHGNYGLTIKADAPALGEALGSYYAAVPFDVSWEYPDKPLPVDWKALMKRAA